MFLKRYDAMAMRDDEVELVKFEGCTRKLQRWRAIWRTYIVNDSANLVDSMPRRELFLRSTNSEGSGGVE